MSGADRIPFFTLRLINSRRHTLPPARSSNLSLLLYWVFKVQCPVLSGPSVISEINQSHLTQARLICGAHFRQPLVCHCNSMCKSDWNWYLKRGTVVTDELKIAPGIKQLMKAQIWSDAIYTGGERHVLTQRKPSDDAESSEGNKAAEVKVTWGGQRRVVVMSGWVGCPAATFGSVTFTLLDGGNSHLEHSNWGSTAHADYL